jgi:hypothetical protein
MENSTMKPILFTLVAALALPGSADAETTLANGFQIDGHVSLSYGGSFDYGANPFISGDTEVSWSNGAFGIDASLIGFAYEDGLDKALYAALTYTFGDGHKLSIGSPRPAYEAYDGFAQTDYFGTGSGFGGFVGTTSVLTSQKMFFDSLPYSILGVRYDGRVGLADVAASLHGSPDGAGYLLSSSAEMELGAGVLAGGVEHLNVDDSRLTAFKVHYGRTYGQFDLSTGLVLTDVNLPGSTFDQKVALIELAADYRFDERWSAGVLLIQAKAWTDSGSGTLSLTGARGRYAFGNGLSAEALVFDASGGGVTQFNLNLRYDF